MSKACHWPVDIPAAVQVTGQFGWLTVPGPIVQATAILAVRLLKRGRDAPLGVINLAQDVIGHIAKTDPDVQALIDPYKRDMIFA
jgi:hypothetical protein